MILFAFSFLEEINEVIIFLKKYETNAKGTIFMYIVGCRVIEYVG